MTFPARFDGKQILFDDTVTIKPNTRVLVTVLSDRNKDTDCESWQALTTENLARAYGDNEPEYLLSMVKETNSSYIP